MRPSVFKALQFAVSTLGLGTLRLKQPENQAESVVITPLPEASKRRAITATAEGDRQLQTIDLLVQRMSQIRPYYSSSRDWESSRAFSLQLVRLARGTGIVGTQIREPESEPLEPAVEAGNCRVFALAIGFAVAQQNRLREVFSGIFDCELDFVTLDAIAARQQEAGKAALILINIASVAVTKRLARQFLELAESGRPTLFTGSRTALKSLGVLTNRPSTEWDFLPVPWDRDELVWRVLRLMHREPLAFVPPPPPKRPPVTPIGRAMGGPDAMQQAC